MFLADEPTGTFWRISKNILATLPRLNQSGPTIVLVPACRHCDQLLEHDGHTVRQRTSGCLARAIVRVLSQLPSQAWHASQLREGNSFELAHPLSADTYLAARFQQGSLAEPVKPEA